MLFNLSLPHLIIVPILLPLLTAALLLVVAEKRKGAKRFINLVSSLLGLGVAVTLLRWVDGQGGPGAVGVYLPSNWEIPFGIVLAVDRLSAMMLVLTAALGVAASLFSMARWYRMGVHFFALIQIQLMGLNGAFLTADLFNLFVFFEVLLAASYGLLLHGSGWARVRSGLHYITINLLASFLLLIGIALIYGVCGSLNMADVAHRISQVPEGELGLLHAGAAILAIAFLAKAAIWPLGFWLVPAYSAASAPVAAIFAIMTKVGFYSILRLWPLFFPGSADVFGANALAMMGLATMLFGTFGLLSSLHLGRIAGYSVIVSSGMLLTALSLRVEAVTGGALFYLLNSILASAAFFLLLELVEKVRKTDHDTEQEEEDEYWAMSDETNLDDEEQALFGRVVPAAMAFLGLSFIACTLLLAGLPPLSGFVGKVAILSALLNPSGLGDSGGAGISTLSWSFFALVILSGLAALISLSRVGIRHFWTPQEHTVPTLKVTEGLPVAGLIAACAFLAFQADSALRFTQDTAEALHNPEAYIDAVISTKPIPYPTQITEETQP